MSGESAFGCQAYVHVTNMIVAVRVLSTRHCASSSLRFTKISIDNIRTILLQPGENGGRGAVERDSKGISWQNWEAMQGEVA